MHYQGNGALLRKRCAGEFNIINIIINDDGVVVNIVFIIIIIFSGMGSDEVAGDKISD